MFGDDANQLPSESIFSLENNFFYENFVRPQQNLHSKLMYVLNKKLEWSADLDNHFYKALHDNKEIFLDEDNQV